MATNYLVWTWVGIGGVLMVLMGLLARNDTGLVGTAPDALLRMNAMHGEVHAVGGALAIVAGLLLRGSLRAAAILGYGVLFVLGFVLNVISPDFFGMMPDAPANRGVHMMHAGVALLSIATAFVAQPRTDPHVTRARTTPRHT